MTGSNARRPRPGRGRPPRLISGATPRSRLTRAAGQLMRRRGYHATGLNQVVAESGAPKGSLYHYFPDGKEQLASEAIARGGAAVTRRIEESFARTGSAAEAMQAIGRLLADNLAGSGFRDGCPVGTVTLDVASESDRIHRACAASFGAWRDSIAARLRGDGRPDAEADQLAVLIISSFEGTLMMARALRDTGPLFVVAESLAAGLDTNPRRRS